MLRGEFKRSSDLPEPVSAKELREKARPVLIGGERVLLKPLRVEDSQAYVDLVDFDRAHLKQYGDTTGTKYLNAEDVVRSIVDPKNPYRLRFGIWNPDVMVGTVNLEPTDTGIEIGYWVGKEHVRRGYALDAVKALSGYAFDQLKYPLIEAEAVRENEASRRVLELAGFKDTGGIRGKWSPNELGRDVCWIYTMYALENPRFSAS